MESGVIANVADQAELRLASSGANDHAASRGFGLSAVLSGRQLDPLIASEEN